MRRALRLPTAAVLLAGLSGACGLLPAPPPAEPVDIAGTWALEEGTIDGVRIDAIAGTVITLDSRGDAAVGSAGCNDYTMALALDGASIALGPPVITDRACPVAVMAVEERFLAGMGRAASVRTEGDTLVLSASGVELRFVRTAILLE